MNRADLMEIKKRWKVKDYSISQFSYCVFSSEEGVIRTCVKSFGSLSDDEIKKYLSLMGKGYSTGTTSYNETLKVEDEDLYKCLEYMVKASSDDMLVALSNYISTKYDVPGYYALLCFRDAYDIPARDEASNQKMDESDEVYEYASILLCPLKPNKGGICFMDNELVLEKALPFVQTPVMGMIYPAYTDKSADEGNAFVCVKSDPERRLVSELFSVDVPDKPKPQARIKESVAETLPLESADDVSDDGYQVHAQEHISVSEDNSEPSYVAPESSTLDAEIEKALDEMEENRHKQQPISSKKENTDSSDGYKDLSDVSGDADRKGLSGEITKRSVGGKDYYIIPAEMIPEDILKMLMESGS